MSGQSWANRICFCLEHWQLCNVLTSLLSESWPAVFWLPNPSNLANYLLPETRYNHSWPKGTRSVIVTKNSSCQSLVVSLAGEGGGGRVRNESRPSSLHPNPLPLGTGGYSGYRFQDYVHSFTHANYCILSSYETLGVLSYFAFLCLGNCMSEFMGLIHGKYEAKVP